MPKEQSRMFVYDLCGLGESGLTNRMRVYVTPLDFRYQLENDLRIMVREIGYHVCRMKAERHPQDEEYSRSMTLYRTAVELLRKYGMNQQDTEWLVKATYNPDDVKPGDNVTV